MFEQGPAGALELLRPAWSCSRRNRSRPSGVRRPTPGDEVNRVEGVDTDDCLRGMASARTVLRTPPPCPWRPPRSVRRVRSRARRRTHPGWRCPCPEPPHDLLAVWSVTRVRYRCGASTTPCPHRRDQSVQACGVQAVGDDPLQIRPTLSQSTRQPGDGALVVLVARNATRSSKSRVKPEGPGERHRLHPHPVGRTHQPRSRPGRSPSTDPCRYGATGRTPAECRSGRSC